MLQRVRRWLASYTLLPPLLPQTFNINRQDTGGTTALHWAAAQGHANIVNDLLNAGANWRLENAEGLTPYQLAERNRNEAIAAHDATQAQKFKEAMDAITHYLTRGTAEITLGRALKQLTGAGKTTGTAPEEIIQMIMRQNIPQRPLLGGGSR